MRFYFSHVTVPGIIYYIENARGCTASHRLCERCSPPFLRSSYHLRMILAQEHPTPTLPTGRAHLRMGVAHPLCAPAGEAEPLRGSLIDSAESMSGSGSGSAALNR